MRTQSDIMYILFRRGWTIREISLLFACDAKTVRRHVDQERWKHWEIVISPQKLKEVYARYKSVRRVANELMCSTGTAYKKLKENGII